MLIKKDMKEDLKLELNVCGEWFSRGERGFEEECKVVNFDLIRRVWDDRDEDGEVDDEKLNTVECRIIWGDGDFCDNGVEQCMSRVDELLEGKSIMIEMEEGMYCIGSKGHNETQIDYMKFKIDLLKGC
tara:strand:- start:42 stop:428 length:387 start_codon:yes stop_codon:yes gene_type:complete